MSDIPFANLDMEFPVHGAITRTSISFLGPMGSTSVSAVIGFLPEISWTASYISFAVPNLVSVFATAGDRIG